MTDEHITLREASKYSGYHPDYISSLIREGTLEGRKVGRSWVTTYSAIQKYLKYRNKKENPYFKIETPKEKRKIYTKPAFLFISTVIIFITVTALTTIWSESGETEFNADTMIRSNISDDVSPAIEIISVYGE